MTNDSKRPTFEEHVFEWLKGEESRAVSVEGVESYGTDWAGDTEGGFYSQSDVTIKWTDTEGVVHFREIQGEAMGSLWDHVVKGWS